MFRSCDYLQAEIFPSEDGHKNETCSGYWIKYSNQCCVRRKPWTWPSTRNRMQATNFKMYIFPPEDGHKTKTCSGYWLKYSNQCCVRRKPWTWPSTRNRMQTTNFKIINASQAYSIHKAMYIFPPEDGHKAEICNGYWIKYSNVCCVRRKPWTWPSTRNRMQTTHFKMYIFPLEDSHKTETCSGYWIKYSNQCCVRRKPWTWPSTRNRMQTIHFKNIAWS
jgi:N6-adenosine-specific RNA methylase IME4